MFTIEITEDEKTAKDDDNVCDGDQHGCHAEGIELTCSTMRCAGV